MVELWAQILFQSAWQAAIASALLLAIPILFPRSSPRLKHALGALVLIKLCIPPLFVLPTGLLTVLDAQTPQLRTAVTQAVEMPMVALVIVVIHIGGMLVVLAGRARGALWLRRLRHESNQVRTGEIAELFHETARRIGMRSVPDLFVSAQTSIPFATGVIRPAVVLPASAASSLRTEELAHVMSHELTHHHHGDLRWCLLESILGVIWWFHPVFHAAVRVTRRAREESCDDSVIEQGAEARSYALAILETARRSAFPIPLSAVSEATGYPLARRLVRIAGEQVRFTSKLSLIQRAVIVILALAILPGMAPRRTHPEEPQPEPGFHFATHRHQHHHNH